jgi:hypothetical protein
MAEDDIAEVGDHEPAVELEPALDPEPPLEPPHANVAPASSDVTQTLDEWIGREFARGVNAGLLGGFQHEEYAAGRHRDTAAAYAERYAAFADAPVL